jgi:hypothetical protein
MSDTLTRIEEKLDRQSERLNSVDVTLAKQAVSLNEHMRRTELLETGLAQVHSQIRPLEVARHEMTGANKLFLFVLGAIPVAIEILHLLHGK